MENCIFCDGTEIEQDILKETDNFFVKVGFALYSPGQVMVIPKKHYICSAEFPDNLEPEFEKLELIVSNEIINKFSEPFQMEMGNWGQSVRHSHTHFVPLKSSEYEVKNIMNEMVDFGPDKILYEETDRLGLKEIYRKERAYVSIKQKGKLYVCHVAGLDFDSENPHSQLTLRSFFLKKD